MADGRVRERSRAKAAAPRAAQAQSGAAPGAAKVRRAARAPTRAAGAKAERDAAAPTRAAGAKAAKAGRAASGSARGSRGAAGEGAESASAAKVRGAGGAGAPASAPLPGWVERVIEQARGRADARAAALRARHPGESPRQLGERLVRSSAFRAGLWGAATGTLALVALPVGLPAGVALTLLLEAELLFTLLALYGLASAGDRGRLRLAALWAGAGFADAAKSAGLRLGATALGEALAGSLPARIIARLNPALIRAVLRRLGLGFLPRALRLWPLLGAPIAFVLDRSALRALGRAALATLDSLHVESVPRH